MSAGRYWTEAEAKAWLKASLPKGVPFLAAAHPRVGIVIVNWGNRRKKTRSEFVSLTLRGACLDLVRAAKRAGINVNAAPEPQGGSK